GRGPERRVRAGTDRLLEEVPEVRGAGWIRVPMVADVGAHAAAALRDHEADASRARTEQNRGGVLRRGHAVEEDAGEEETLGAAADAEARPCANGRAPAVGAD